MAAVAEVVNVACTAFKFFFLIPLSASHCCIKFIETCGFCYVGMHVTNAEAEIYADLVRMN